MLRRIDAGVLDVAFTESGPASGRPVVLLHGFPYDAHAYDDVVPLLVAAGRRVIVPYLRGYGPTAFLSPETPRSGQQAALAHDLLADRSARSRSRGASGLRLGWSCRVHRGRAVARTRARSRDLWWLQHFGCRRVVASTAPEVEHALWYQYYFHSERGRAGLEQHRYEYCKLLWSLWSPKWDFDDATYAQTSASFDNPDFVDVVIHSYRQRFGLAPGDPAVEETETRVATRPTINVPTISLHGGDNGVAPVASQERNRHLFTSEFERYVIPLVGHNVPQEAPRPFAEAILTLR